MSSPLSHFWYRISTFGLRGDEHEEERMRIKLANQLGLLFMAIDVVYVFLVGSYRPFSLLQMCVFVLLAMQYLFVARGHFKAARLWTLIVVVVAITVLFGVGNDGRDHRFLVPGQILLLATVAIGPAYFDYNDRKWFLLAIFFPLSAFVLIQPLAVLIPDMPFDFNKNYQLRYYFASAIAFASIATGITFLSRRNNLLVDRLKTQLAAAEENRLAAEQSLEQLRATQSQLVISEKMASLGQLLASVAHEINTPLSTISASAHSLQSFLPDALRQLPKQVEQLAPEVRDLFFEMLEQALTYNERLSTREEREIKRKLTVWAEENHLKDPDELSNTLLKLGLVKDLDRYIPALLHPQRKELLNLVSFGSRTRQGLEFIQAAASKTQKLVQGLKTYARSMDTEPLVMDVRENIQLVLGLYHSQMSDITLITQFADDLPLILGVPDELNQVWANLVANALQAMGGNGTLEVTAEWDSEGVDVLITDSGPGISIDVQDRIFEAFFTTKPKGEGTGLGLDISRKIVQRHSGSLTFRSVPGRTTFRTRLPFNGPILPQA